MNFDDIVEAMRLQFPRQKRNNGMEYMRDDFPFCVDIHQYGAYWRNRHYMNLGRTKTDWMWCKPSPRFGEYITTEYIYTAECPPYYSRQDYEVFLRNLAAAVMKYGIPFVGETITRL